MRYPRRLVTTRTAPPLRWLPGPWTLVRRIRLRTKPLSVLHGLWAVIRSFFPSRPLHRIPGSRSRARGCVPLPRSSSRTHWHCQKTKDSRRTKTNQDEPSRALTDQQQNKPGRSALAVRNTRPVSPQHEFTPTQPGPPACQYRSIGPNPIGPWCNSPGRRHIES